MKISRHGCKLVLFVTYGYFWKCAKCLQTNVTSEIKWDIPKPLSGLYTFPNEHAPDMPRYAMKIFKDPRGLGMELKPRAGGPRG